MAAGITEFELLGNKVLVNITPEDIAQLLKGANMVKVFVKDGLDTTAIAKRIKGCRSLLVSIEVGKDIGIKDVGSIVDTFAKSLKPAALIMYSVKLVKASKGKLLAIAAW